jgi:two-component system chemotaxis response regulator CheY
MRTTLKSILTKSGYEIVGEACDGLEAIKLYNKLHPDVVTMDLHMPQMDGITAVKEIKKIDPQAKIIMCTTMGQKAVVMEAITAGAKGYIVKPLQAKSVLEAIDKLAS